MVNAATRTTTAIPRAVAADEVELVDLEEVPVRERVDDDKGLV
jgi:hypothetical protein